jgi:hypothetical protein
MECSPGFGPDRRRAALELGNRLCDLLRRRLARRRPGQVRRDGHPRVAPERVIGGQRFGAEHVEHGAGEVTGIEELQQVVVDDRAGAADVDQVRACRKLRQAGAVEQVARLVGERQRVDQDPRAGEEFAELRRAGEALDAFDPPGRA